MSGPVLDRPTPTLEPAPRAFNHGLPPGPPIYLPTPAAARDVRAVIAQAVGCLRTAFAR